MLLPLIFAHLGPVATSDPRVSNMFICMLAGNLNRGRKNLMHV